ncbi:recombinase family protein [Mycobacterium paragordonae]|uniref:Recombinase family protein n=1 Tax=Mycobacterium paragordonae TaxID=1389713 RepID=A0AAJ1RZH9_9MYCO|nr:recombinase family protein [Mycobacterium paragordonae]MDP7733630.1 recombinase family protein [Mycobacterium paragordonae]
MSTQLRALVGARVSVVHGPQKVSHIAQRATGERWATERGYPIVGTFEDLDVSATVSPFERPDLGPWLSPEKQGEWDVLVFSKIDRMFRSTRDCVRFAEWAEGHKKILVFAEDSMTLNYRDKSDSLESMMSELFIYIGSFFAQLELNRFKSRARDGHRVIRETDRWASGVPPLGYQIVDHPSGKGRGLATDSAGKELLHQMAGKLLEGWSFSRIAEWLNDTGARTNRDRVLIEKGQPPRENPWTTQTVQNILSSPRTQGLRMHKKVTALDANGDPIRMAPATFDDDTWKQIQDAVAIRKTNRRGPTVVKNPMLGVGYCGLCGSSLAQKVTQRYDKVYRYYNCGRTPVNCRGVTIRADDADRLLEEAFISLKGNDRVTRRVFVPGEDNSHELEQLRATIARLRRESDVGLIVSDEDERIYLERMRSLVDRRTKLEQTPFRSAGWVTEETDQTYAEVWPDSDHRQLIIDAGIRFVLKGEVGGQPVDYWLDTL